MSNQLGRALEAIDAGLLEHPGQGAPSEADALRELRWVAEDVGYTRECCEIIRAYVTTLRASHWAVAEFAQAPVSDENSSVYLNARYHTLGLIGLEAFFADLEDRIGHHLPSDGSWDGVIQGLRAMLFCCAPSATSRQMQEATVIWTSRDGVSASFHLGSFEARSP